MQDPFIPLMLSAKALSTTQSDSLHFCCMRTVTGDCKNRKDKQTQGGTQYLFLAYRLWLSALPCGPFSLREFKDQKKVKILFHNGYC